MNRLEVGRDGCGVVDGAAREVETPPPLFSVILPTRNRSTLLTRAVASVLHQTSPEFELLIVDDGSDDATPAVAAAIEDHRVRVLWQGQHQGVAAARNRAAREARGTWLTFLDDDDEYFPGYLERMKDAVAYAPAETGFAWSGIRKVRDTDQGVLPVADDLWIPTARSLSEQPGLFLRECRIGTGCGLAVRRNVLLGLGGFDEDLPCASDAEFILRLARSSRFTVVPEILVVVHAHEGLHRSRGTVSKSRAIQRIIERNSDVLSKDRNLWWLYHLRAGLHALKGGDRTRAWRFFSAGARGAGWGLRVVPYLCLLLSGRTGVRAVEWASAIKARLEKRSDRGKGLGRSV